MNSNNESHSINKQAIDEDLINAVQKRPALYDYRMPLKERSRQNNDLWKKVSEDLNGIYTPIEAEKRWNYLKDRYRKSVNSYKIIQESSLSLKEAVQLVFLKIN
ncbi:hypothetical protein ALC57_11250 [Trachymyrmex cornetzi]|uniref:MADF domain-containing protein n=1 Tax=Trachymyrmex cornetzi TaxID=471704 RepID=A0A151J2T9_9HYME|nr:hypothetical protein ALC57_11250 [Trachymyrmex cornetzi]